MINNKGERHVARPNATHADDQQPAPAGATTINLSLTVPADVPRDAADVLSAVVDGIGSLLLPPQPAPKKPSGTHPHAQALAAGIMLGLGDKYQDTELSAAGARLAAQAQGFPIASAAKPQQSKPFKGNPRNKRMSKGRRK
jgi:hypothetical protein